MLQMNQIDQIKELQRQGLGPLEIAGRLKLSRKTVAKYMKVEDFNGSTPGKRAPASKLDPWKPKIDEWLAEDRRMRFKCHYGFSVSFCNPEAGHEKGHVENKVGYVRRNFFVPIPEVRDLESWNRELLGQAEEDFDRPHYKKGLTINELWAEERRHLSPLPERPFAVERLEKARTNGYGKFCLDGRHWYPSAPEHAEEALVVGLKAHTVVVYGPDGSVVALHPRSFGDRRTDTADYATSLETLLRRPRAWTNSPFRAGLSETLRESLDGLDRPDLRRVLTVLADSFTTFGPEVALESLEEAVRRQTVDAFSLLETVS